MGRNILFATGVSCVAKRTSERTAQNACTVRSLIIVTVLAPLPTEGFYQNRRLPSGAPSPFLQELKHQHLVVLVMKIRAPDGQAVPRGEPSILRPLIRHC